MCVEGGGTFLNKGRGGAQNYVGSMGVGYVCEGRGTFFDFVSEVKSVGVKSDVFLQGRQSAQIIKNLDS